MPEKYTSEEVLSLCLDKMITDKKENAGLDPAQRAQLKKELRERLDDMVNEAMIAAIPDDKIIELDERMKEGMTDKQIEDFLMNSGADFEGAAVQAVAALRKEYLGEETTTATTNSGEEK